MLCFTRRRRERSRCWSTCICCVTLGEGEKGVGAGVPGTDPLAIPKPKEIYLILQYPRLGREPPDAMSLCYADIEPPRFARQTEPPLCRQSLRYAVNEPPPYSTAFFKSWFF